MSPSSTWSPTLTSIFQTVPVMWASTSATRRDNSQAVTPEPARVVIVAAQNEADRIGAALDALAEALPGARLMVADDASTDGTQTRPCAAAPGW